MHAHSISNSVHPIVYTDQKRRKVFVMSEDRASLIPPSAVCILDNGGNQIMVPADVHGDATVMDVSKLNAGGYFVQFFGVSEKSIRIILF